MTAPEPSPYDRQAAQLRSGGRGPTPAPRTTVIRPDEWAYDYDAKATEPIVVGLRELSGADSDRALFVADEVGQKQGEAARKSTLAAYLVARGICDPNDFSQPHPAFETAEDIIPLALSRPTIDRLCAELADLVTERSPLELEADDEEIYQLGIRLLTDAPFENVTPARAGFIRRYLRKALTEFNDAEDEQDSPEN